jgi:hypothetical protein
MREEQLIRRIGAVIVLPSGAAVPGYVNAQTLLRHLGLTKVSDAP